MSGLPYCILRQVNQVDPCGHIMPGSTGLVFDYVTGRDELTRKTAITAIASCTSLLNFKDDTGDNRLRNIHLVHDTIAGLT